MDNSLELQLEQRFTIKLSQVDIDNVDGRNRQEVLSNCKVNDIVDLERDTENKKDRYSILVKCKHNHIMGVISNKQKLALHLDRGGRLEAKIKKIVGKPTFIQKAFRIKGKGIICYLDVTRKDYDPARFKEFIEKDKDISRTIARAEMHEKDNMRLAIKNYKQAIEQIKDFDEGGVKARSWRRTAIPVNRLSMLYEKQKKYQEALDLINWYFSYNDYSGISKYDNEMIRKRKSRISKKL